ncbi:peptidoglycan-binding domain-containing protein [Streptomyces coryli]|uniref:peptidoglycan-binding domain-containing protein n=1 Tax=Streptomyces coryli TaxID=1128680 RepID=UPI0030B8BC89
MSATAVAGIAAGSLAGAGPALAASPPATAASAQDVSVLAVNNLGLEPAQAKKWQCWLRRTGYNPGTIDGLLGTASWKAAQRKFNDMGLGAGTPDGVVGPNTIRALQRYLNKYNAGLDVDGIAGPQTRFAFALYASGLPRC